MKKPTESNSSLIISSAELKRLVLQFDQELTSENVPIIGRPLRVIEKVCKHFNCSLSSDDPLWHAIVRIGESLYPRQSLVLEPILTGVFFFQGCIYKAEVPLVFNAFRLNPDDILESLPPLRKEALFLSKKAFAKYLLNTFNLVDLGWGFYQLFDERRSPSMSLAMLKNGKAQLESAATSALQPSNYAASMHAAQLAIELIIKGALSHSGFSEAELIKIRHNHEKMASSLCEYYLNFEMPKVMKLLSCLPRDMNARYQEIHYNEQQVGKALMAVQELAAQVLRLLSTCNIRALLARTGQRIELCKPIPLIHWLP